MAQDKALVEIVMLGTVFFVSDQCEVKWQVTGER